jgi:glycosyltransferase involved in cell wall biosynthesis
MATDARSAPGSDAPPRLSVIVPVHNGGLQLSRCLEGLRLSDYDSFEVIVVDDCSTDNSPQIVQRFGARCLRTPHKMGPGGARNLGTEHAHGEIVVFVDADVVVPPGALRRISERFAQDADLAAVFGSYDESPAWNDFLSQYKNLMHHYVHQISSERAVTFWAGCGAMRRVIFRQFGGFNAKRYPVPSIEDIELGYRLSGAGRKILLDKQLQVKHLKKWTVRGLLRADILCRAVPWTKLILETQNLPRDLNLTYASQISSLLVGILALLLVLAPFSATGVFQWLSPAVLLGAAAAAIAILLILNRRVYAWFAARRGWWFAAGAVIAHWAYYFYSGVVFGTYAAAHFLRSFLAAAMRGIGMGPARARD